MVRPGERKTTMKEWLESSFGATLCEYFFFPFHDLYTDGLYDSIAPQDSYKSPVDLAAVRRGSIEAGSQAGYNVSFLYPERGLDALARELASRCRVQYAKRQ